MGQSRAVAEKHYLQTTDEDWSEGATKVTVSMSRGNTGGNTPANVGEHRQLAQKEKPGKTPVGASPGFQYLT
jgi:hypothetical protein